MVFNEGFVSYIYFGIQVILVIFRYFFFSNLDNWVKEMNDKSDILMEKLRLLADGKQLVTLYRKINRFALDVISSVRNSFLLKKKSFNI